MGDDVLKWVTAMDMGAPLSRQSLHDRFRRRDITKMKFEEEIAQIERESALSIPGGPGTGDEPSGDGE
jgi:hypothetical protein